MRKHLIFSGTVQGVGFRYTSQILANRWGLSGWVRNLRSGEVEMLIEGRDSDIEGFLADLNRHFLSYIKDVKELPDADDFTIKSGFYILPTV